MAQAEKDQFLSRIFGEDASIKIDTYEKNGVIFGSYETVKGVTPLQGVEPVGEGISLLLTDAHMAGHFRQPSGPQTFPGYRYMEFAALSGKENVTGLTGAKFEQIATPGDQLVAYKESGEDKTRVMRGFSEAASTHFTFGEDGVPPHLFGTLIEVSTHTLIANGAKLKEGISDSYFPLIIGIDKIDVFNPDLGEKLTVVPVFPDYFEDGDRFTASTAIMNDKGNLVATITNLRFHFAQAWKIKHYIEMKKRESTSLH